MEGLLKICELEHISVYSVFEVGIFDMPHSMDFINADKKVTLIEADPDFSNRWINEFKYNRNVHIITKAILDKPGNAVLCRNGGASFIEGINSPSVVGGNGPDTCNKITVEGITFDEIDPGNIDVLLADIEGSEYFVLKYMRSRPKLICLEMFGPNYENPFRDEIHNWLNSNNYLLIAGDLYDRVYRKI